MDNVIICLILNFTLVIVILPFRMLNSQFKGGKEAETELLQDMAKKNTLYKTGTKCTFNFYSKEQMHLCLTRNKWNLTVN